MNKTTVLNRTTAMHFPIDQSARESNINAIVAFVESGIKKSTSQGKIGIELEHIVVHNNMEPVSYYEQYGIAWLLERLKAHYPFSTTDSEGHLLGVSKPYENVTIEPAAQLELSAGPFTDLATAEKTFSSFERLIESILASVEEKVLTEGYHPSSAACDLKLIPKRRYEYMDKYFNTKDIYGSCMMRGSASTQISIDYTSVTDCIRKLRLAYALVPILSLICDNTIVFEGKPRAKKLVRTKIWQHVDNDRCGLIPALFDPHFTLRHFASYVLDTPAILVPTPKGQWRYSEQTFGEIYAIRTMTQAEIEHALSMMFNDVRLKTYIEIRPADSMPVPYVIAYAGLIKGLFYSPRNLDILDELFTQVRATDYESAKNELEAHGYHATVYDRPAATLCDRIMELANQGLSAAERPYLEPLARLIEQRRTLADIAENI